MRPSSLILVGPPGGPFPPHLRDTHYPGAARLGAGKGYRYPHDYPGGVVEQQYAPDVIADRRYYQPTDREPRAAARAAESHRALHGGQGTPGQPGDQATACDAGDVEGTDD